MAKRIRAVRRVTETYYADDGTVERELYRVAYLKEAADDPELSRWVDVEAPTRDEQATVTAERDAERLRAETAEGIRG